MLISGEVFKVAVIGEDVVKGDFSTVEQCKGMDISCHEADSNGVTQFLIKLKSGEIDRIVTVDYRIIFRFPALGIFIKQCLDKGLISVVFLDIDEVVSSLSEYIKLEESLAMGMLLNDFIGDSDITVDDIEAYRKSSCKLL